MNRKILIELLEQYAFSTPNKIAIEYKGEQLTYREFQYKTNAIRDYILQITEGKNVMIPIRLKNELNAILAIYGIVKANCAYVPLPKELTSRKCKDILRELDTDFYITDFDEKDYNKSRISFDDLLLVKDSKRSYKVDYHEDNYFYMIYTSGTTGNPKGCMLQDKSVIYRLNTLNQMFPFDKDSKYLLSTNYSFDVSVTEIFGWLFGGGSVYLYDHEVPSYRLPELIYENDITHIAFAPSYFKTILNKNNAHYFQKLKYIFLAGEKLTLDLAQQVRDLIPNGDSYNLYGPTEATIYCTYFRLKDLNASHKSVPIGKALDGVEITIDYQGSEQHNIGEILIGGIGLAQGYYKNKVLTDKKFMTINGQRFYRSGDLGSIEDGQLIFHGRIDNQIKINGVRVEVEEIEGAIREVFEVNGVVVRQEEYRDRKLLVAYLESGGRNISIKNGRTKLEEIIERYYIPNYFICVDKFPLNKNKKIDTHLLREKLLKDMERAEEGEVEFTDTEAKLKDIWTSILKSKISKQDDFYLRGGDSLDSMTLAMKIEEVFHITLSTEDLFRYSVFSEQIKLIENQLTRENDVEFKAFWIDKFDFIIDAYISQSESTLEIEHRDQIEMIMQVAKEVKEELRPKRIVLKDSPKINTRIDSLKLPIMAKDCKSINKFPLFSRQEFYLRKNFHQYLSRIIELEAEDTEQVIRSINQLIHDQLLLRVTIEEGQFIEKEIKEIQLKDLHNFDLSNISYDNYLDKRNEIQDQVIKAMTKMTIFGKFMYELVIIKKNIAQFEIIVIMNHNIADANALNTLERLLIDNHYKKKTQLDKYNYRDFIYDVLHANNDKTILALEKSKYYQELKYAITEFNSNYQLEDIVEVYEFIFDNNHIDKMERGNFVFDKIVEIVYKKTGQQIQAYQILKNLDTFNNKTYKNQIGDYHVSVFVPFNCEKESNLYTKSEHILDEIYNNNQWHIDYLCSSDAYKDNLKTQLFEKVSLSINYLGEFSEIDVKDWRNNAIHLMESLKKLHHSKVRITCFNSGNKSYIYFLNGMSFEKRYQLNQAEV